MEGSTIHRSNPAEIHLEINVFNDLDPSCEVNSLPITEQEWENWFRTWLVNLQPNLSPIHAYALSLQLTQDPQMQHLNATYRHINQPTDVLAFASLEREGLPPQVWQSQPLELGDIIISTETAQRQAQEHHHSYRQELSWLACHGLLHLLGWDHPNEQDLEKMLNQQQKLLTLVGLMES